MQISVGVSNPSLLDLVRMEASLNWQMAAVPPKHLRSTGHCFVLGLIPLQNALRVLGVRWVTGLPWMWRCCEPRAADN